MAINSFDIVSCNKFLPMSVWSGNSSKGGNLPSRLVKIDFATAGSITSVTSRLRKSVKSPYLVGDKTQPTCRVIDKKAVQKKTTDIVSSDPLAANIYKSNSDEFKPVKRNRKVKKSVLTLPNAQSLTAERCTVSDMNDSEYFNKDDGSRKYRPKKKNSCQNNKKNRSQNNNDFEFYDRDARYCSQLNIDLDSSSTDMIRHFDGDGKKVSQRNKPYLTRKSQAKGNFNGHNVWKVLRNINRFQFKPSPPASDDSIVKPKKKKIPKRCNRKDTRFIGTCRTEEFAYISSIEVDSKSPRSFSQSSSFDRITVIDKQDEFSNLSEEFEKTIVRTHNLAKDGNINHCNRPKNRIYNIKKIPKLNNPLCKHKDREIKSIDKCVVMRKGNRFNNKNPQENYIVSSGDIIKKSENPVGRCISHLNTGSKQMKVRTNEPDELHEHFVYSGNSGSSKAGCNHLKVNEQTLKLTSDKSKKHLKGITKVVLTKGEDTVLAKRTELQKIKSGLVTAIPNTMVIHKLTQVRSSDFSETYKNIKSYKNIENKIHKTNGDIVQTENRLNRRKGKNPVTYNLSSKEERINKIDLITDRKVMEGNQLILQIKQKPIQLLKDKMLKLLYKKSTATNCYQVAHQVGGGDVKNVTSENFGSKNDIVTSPNTKRSPAIKEQSQTRHKNSLNPVFMKASSPIMKASWTKASTFIETIIMNIKNGVYYNEDHKYVTNKRITISKEASIQTTLTLKDILKMKIDQIECLKDATPNEISTTNHSLFTSIPGFDYILPDLELKTLNMNTIEVKHCVTNVLVQFDVKSPMEPDINLMGFKNTSSLIPLEVTDTDTKVFKCNTSIINAMLPAELCSILPKMLRNLITSDMRLTFPLLPVNQTESHLSTISELSFLEHPDSSKSANIYTPSHLGCSLDGIFTQLIKNNSKQFINKVEWTIRRRNLDLLPRLSCKLFFPHNVSPRKIIYLKELRAITPITSQGKGESPIQKQKLCTTIQSYSLSNWRVATTFKPYDFNDMICRIWAYYNYSSIFLMPVISFITVSLDNSNKISVDIALNKKNNERKIFAALNNLKTDSNLFTKQLECSVSNNIKTIIEIPVNKNRSVNQVKASSPKVRTKGYMKLYKKCKSTTNISSEKHVTSLHKIENLDDFFELLGSRKIFSSIFDGHAGLKIMSSIAEMKNWIMEINSRQALLVLLLVNKKDTLNLVRFRPILLQGIAVNRITRASELDMEIEVIERENLNSFSQFEGISYLPASIENHDNLLKELYWIAKTTASDYQKSFDESSEKLLKSLVEKRKKLNPSYLRLMARYVGLGLLKSQIRK